jgi:hypothetical protein
MSHALGVASFLAAAGILDTPNSVPSRVQTVFTAALRPRKTALLSC